MNTSGLRAHGKNPQDFVSSISQGKTFKIIREEIQLAFLVKNSGYHLKVNTTKS